MPRGFDHEKLKVFWLALDVVAFAEDLSLWRKHRHLADQLHRASTSIAFNIAEGAGEFSSGEKVRFYRIAQRSATECAAILQVLVRLRVLTAELAETGLVLLREIVAMLIGLCQSHERAATRKKQSPSRSPNRNLSPQLQEAARER